MVKLLDFSEKESEYFFHLVLAKTAKSHKQKIVSEEFINEHFKPKIPLYLDLDSWSLLDYEGWDIVWNFLAFSSDFRDLKKLSKVIQMSSSEILVIIRKMEEIGLVTYDEGLVTRLKTDIHFGNSISNKSIKNHHKRKIIKSLKALDFQDQDTRKTESITFTMNKEHFKKLSLRIEIFVDNFLKEIDEEEKHDDVSTLTVSLFSCLK
jgi:uncharacterized protein (TIGR02147 family)